jgi:hypothetical protein
MSLRSMHRMILPICYRPILNACNATFCIGDQPAIVCYHYIVGGPMFDCVPYVEKKNRLAPTSVVLVPTLWIGACCDWKIKPIWYFKIPAPPFKISWPLFSHGPTIIFFVNDASPVWQEPRSSNAIWPARLDADCLFGIATTTRIPKLASQWMYVCISCQVSVAVSCPPHTRAIKSFPFS